METLLIQPKMKFESSIIHEAAVEFEKRSGYEVTVIGDAVIDTICELEPENITLYLSKPYDTEQNGGDFSKTIEELTNKGVYSFKEDKEYGNNTVSIGTWDVLGKEIQLIIGQESANEYVQQTVEMDILLATYSVGNGLYVPSHEVEKAITSKTISYHSKRYVTYDGNSQPIISYLRPTDAQMIRILKATGRYQFGLIPIYARPSDHFKEHPFGELKFMDTRQAEDGKESVTSELGNLLTIEVPEYKKWILNIMNYLLLEVGYDFHELKKMGVKLHGYNHGFQVRLLYDDSFVLQSENGTYNAKPIEEVRKVY
jgi:hypothetical protein